MSVTQSIVIPGVWTVSTLPSAASEAMHVAWVSDWPGLGMTLVASNGSTWSLTRGSRFEDYSGNTDAAGNYIVAYASAYESTPNVQPVITSNSDIQFFKLINSSATGFTVQVRERASLTLLTVNLLSFGTTPSVGASVRVLVVGN